MSFVSKDSVNLFLRPYSITRNLRLKIPPSISKVLPLMSSPNNVPKSLAGPTQFTNKFKRRICF